MSILFWKAVFMFIFNLHIPICVKKARSQESTLHWIWKLEEQGVRQILLLHPEVVLGILLLVTSGTPTFTSALHSPFLVGLGDTENVASIDRAPATFLCSLAIANKNHGSLGPLLSYLFADKWKCKWQSLRFTGDWKRSDRKGENSR